MKEEKADWLKEKGLPIMPEYKYVWIKGYEGEWEKVLNPYYKETK